MVLNNPGYDRFFLTPVLSMLVLLMTGTSVSAQSPADYTKLYWPFYENNIIERINFDGTGREILVSNTSTPGYGSIALQVDVPNQKIYWFNDFDYTIERANFDGSDRETFISDPGYTCTIIIDHQNQQLYWPNYEGQRIERINLDGTGRETVVSNILGGGPISIELDLTNQKVYWFDDGSDAIRRANLDGTGIETLLTDPGYPYQLVIDQSNQQLYWTNYDDRSIERINLDGSNRETVVSDAAPPGYGPVSIALDNINNKIYWFDDGSYTILRANKDGTGVESFITDPGYAFSIVIPQDIEGTLPLRLMSFTAHPGPGGVLLQWSTAEEVNTESFGIERAINGGEFVTIGSLNANASNGRYQFADTWVSTQGAYLYRLKMIDKDGKFKYSPTVPVQYSEQAAGDYTLYPNPAVGSFIYLKAPGNAAAALSVRLVDIAGKSWYQQTVSPVNGRYEIPVASLPAGSYLLMIKGEKETNWKTLKFTK